MVLIPLYAGLKQRYYDGYAENMDKMSVRRGMLSHGKTPEKGVKVYDG
jgi:hypothetical protein